MFEGMIRELKRLERQQISVSVPVKADADGFIDKECPSTSCMYKFKVNEQDWADLFKDEAVFCPLCRHEANSDSWWTTEQIEHAKKLAFQKFETELSGAMARGARYDNSRPQSGFIRFSYDVKGRNRRFSLIPMTALSELEQKIKCEKCNARFAVLGSGFFCPCCGYNSAERTFDDAVDKIKSNIGGIPTIRKALEEAGLKDDAAVTVRHIIESSLGAGVTALQRFCEQVYRARFPEKSVPMNAFQRIDFMEQAWKEALGEGLSQWIDEAELRDLTVLYQRRHILQHCEGIVDEKYIQRSGDSAYRAGQRIVVKEGDVLRLSYLVTKIAAAIRSKISGVAVG